MDYGLDELAGDDVEGVYGICRRIRVFYDCGAEMGRMGELMGREKRVFLEVGEEVLKQKLWFFLKMGMEKKKAGVFLLENSEILDLNFESPDIAMPEFLISVGFDKKEAAEISKKYPYVVGKNKLGNLPRVLQAMDLHHWFLDKIAGGNVCYLTPEFAAASVVELHTRNSEEEFLEDLEMIKSRKRQEHVDNKLEFLFSIGFGKNKITSKALSVINGTKDQLQERFNCLIELGIGYSALCRMISATPKLMNQSTESIHEKVNYLCHELGYPLEYLESFPAFLCFDLENRIKPRFKIMNWLKENGLLKKHFSPATILANAEKRFIVNLYSIHPAAPKQWLEIFSSRSDHHGNQRNLF